MQSKWLGMSSNSPAHSAPSLPPPASVHSWCSQGARRSWNPSYLSSVGKHLWAGNLTTKAELCTIWFARKLEQESQNKEQHSFAQGTISASSLLLPEPGASIHRTWPRRQAGLEQSTAPGQPLWPSVQPLKLLQSSSRRAKNVDKHI